MGKPFDMGGKEYIALWPGLVVQVGKISTLEKEGDTVIVSVGPETYKVRKKDSSWEYFSNILSGDGA